MAATQRIPGDEEARGLLRKIVEALAYRQLMLANIRGHGIKYLPDVDHKLASAARLAEVLPPFKAVQELYSELAGGDVVAAVRDRMERIPYPSSRLELAVCLFLCMRAERSALESYQDCAVSSALAELVRNRLAMVSTEDLPRDGTFLEFCADETNRPHAQQMVNRWLTLSLLALGRPGSEGDARAIALGLRSRSADDVARGFLEGLAPFLSATALVIPDDATLGVTLPRGWTSGARSTT